LSRHLPAISRSFLAAVAPVVGIAVIAVLGLVSCASSPRSSGPATAAALDAVLAGDQRSPENRARDVYRHPKETLLFFGIRPQMTVAEIWPEGGWYTEVIAPLVNAKGRYYAAQPPPNPSNPFTTEVLAKYAAKLAAHPELYSGAVVTAFGPGHLDLAPPGSVDLVVTFRNIHNWMASDFAPTAFAAIFRALKPGGVLGVVEHRGPGGGQDPKARSGYVNEDYAIHLIEAAGFRFVAKSEINANPKDTKDYEQGVWTLPPSYRLGPKDREKYATIGESDRFTLKFVKP
jgi:predicted methyltransferase